MWWLQDLIDDFMLAMRIRSFIFFLLGCGTGAFIVFLIMR